MPSNSGFFREGVAAATAPLEPFWRGLVLYRLLVLALAGLFILASLGNYRSVPMVVAALAVMAGWTLVVGVGYWHGGARVGRDRRERLAAVDLCVTAAVVVSTPLVATPEQLAAGLPVMGSVWISGAVVAVAVARGMGAGLLAASAIAVLLLVVHRELGPLQWYDIQLMGLAGLTIGYSATAMKRSAERLRVALAEQGAAAERERLGRSIHDGVLQVLAHVRRRGAEIGGSTGDLARLAGEQEAALRGLLVNGPSIVDSAGRRDLAAALAGLATDRINVAVPGRPVELPAHIVDELVGVVTEALANVTLHVGPAASAWVLIEEQGEAVEVSVRDDGPGIPDGRLAAAHAQGRLGVALSMRGRIAELGGVIDCRTDAELGTEWVVRVPREPADRRGGAR